MSIGGIAIGLMTCGGATLGLFSIGEFEYGSGGLLALVSVALWMIGTFAVRFGLLGNLLLQVGLFFALTVWNMMRRERK